MTLPTLLQQPEADARVELFTLNATEHGVGVLRFTAMTRDTQTIVRYQGHDYQPMPIEADGFAWSGQGPLPRPRLRVSNIGGILGSALGTSDLLGATLTRLVTFRRYLDDEPTADPNAHLEPDIWRIERKTRHDPMLIEWELAASLEQEGRRLPGRTMLADVCSRRYRIFRDGTFDYSRAQCPYTGTLYFDETGAPTNAAGDRCGKRLSDCRARFGQTAVLPTWAFPGLGRTRA